MIARGAARALFDNFESSALRLESRSHTDIPDEHAELAAFLAGELPERYVWEPDDWMSTIARQAAAGKPLRCVRVLDDPLTDYNRYMLYTGQAATGFGEDIRYLAREQANQLGLPGHDFWVFDSSLLVELRFTAAGRLLGHDLVTEPAIVAQHEAWILCGLSAATPSDAYLAEDPTRAWPPVRATAKGRRG